MSQDQVSASFARSYNKAKQFFDDGRIDECIKECQEILEDDAPRYHRIKTLILLGWSVADLSDVGDCYTEADRFYQLAREYHAAGDVEAQQALEELQAALEELRLYVVQRAEQERPPPDEFSDVSDDDDRMEDKPVEEEKGVPKGKGKQRADEAEVKKDEDEDEEKALEAIERKLLSPQDYEAAAAKRSMQPPPKFQGPQPQSKEMPHRVNHMLTS